MSARRSRSATYFLFAAGFVICFILLLLLITPASSFPQLPRLVFGQQTPLPSTSLSSAPPSVAPVTEPTSPPQSTHSIPSTTAEEQQPQGTTGSAEMTIKANKFTPEVLLSAPRRSAAKPNELGTSALYTVSTYSFDSHKKNTEIRLFDVASKESTLVTNEEKTSEPNWLGGEILYLREGNRGTTELVVANIENGMTNYVAAVIPGPISDVKLKSLGQGQVAFLCAGKATPGADLYNPELAPKKNHTGMLYDSLIVRHWDTYLDENRNSLWYGLLTQSASQPGEQLGRWALSSLHNALAGTNLESPIEPFPGTDHFDLGPLGLGFVAKDPDLDPAYNTRTDLYFLPIPDFTKSPSSEPRRVTVKDLEGASTSPSFSEDGKSIVYLTMKKNGYEADKNRMVVVQDVTITGKLKGVELLKSEDGKGHWDRSPSKVIFADNMKRLLILAEDYGKGILFKLDVEDLASRTIPARVTLGGHTSDFVPIGSKGLFLSGDSLVDNSLWSTIDPDDRQTYQVVSSNSRHGAALGLSPNQVKQIYFTGAEGRTIYAWVIMPSKSLSEASGSKKWPLALLIHGGPQGAWMDSWSTRWNPAVFAEQGYVVVTPNPTGSTGYGQALTDAIHKNWGGAPYEDIEACYEYVKKNMSDTVDIDRTVALGASYGGYMMNWIQGQKLADKLKCLVCHDGVFSMENQVSSDEQYFPVHEMGGTYWESRSEYDKWSPARRTEHWKTPMLIIHSEKDYRLPISEGLAAFNVLQGKGVESRFLTFPDENHWVLHEENSLVWHTVVINWINKFVGLPSYKDEAELFPRRTDGSAYGRPKVATLKK